MQRLIDRYWLLILAICVGGILIFAYGRDTVLTNSASRDVTPRGSLASFEQTANDVFTSAAPSVVYVFTERRGRSVFGSGQRQQGTGSGFIWDAAGHVITNHHVIENADRVFVRFDSGATAPATIIGSSPDHDLAVLKVSGLSFGLTPIPVGRSSNLKIGQAVFAIGNPFGLTRSLSTGVVSAVGRRLPTRGGRQIPDAIQTDAAINPGNSGGPLLDSAGRLIGVNTAIISRTRSFNGIGFAVPVDTVNRIAPQIIQRGKPARPGIGIRVAPPELASRLNVQGVVIMEVSPGGPAARAGLIGIDRGAQRTGDVIIAVNGTEVKGFAELANALERVGVGNAAQITVRRNGQQREVTVVLADIG